jgi:cytochrome b pre-mRNA-processing protein 3
MIPVSLWKRLFGPRVDDRAAVRPIWHRTVALAREPGWYAECGVADSMAGRFDLLTLMLALVILRLDRKDEPALSPARLTELFVEDIEGQMRQAGIGDPSVGKRMGKLISTLGGRIAALRAGLAQADDSGLIGASERNVTFGDAPQPALLAVRLRQLALRLDATPGEQLLAGEIAQ